MESPGPQDAPLAEALGALASPTRLALVRALRAPRALREIEVGAADDGQKARPLARQTVREHLEKLVQVGVVSTRETRREYGETVEFVVNHQTLFALSEEMRDLARVRPVVEPQAATLHGQEAPSPAVRGPALVLVKGVDEGATFDLAARPEGPREWFVGRRRGLPVSLDYDPAVSSENARIWWEDGAHWVEDAPQSRNGLRLNLRVLPKGERAKLRHGDLLGVGRSLLLYWS
jgi:DNA-binding transcriptional ArsR family regulator